MGESAVGMSTLNEHSVCEQVLYRGKSKQQWEYRNISIKMNERSGKNLLEVQRIQRKQIFWRVKKTETVELMPNSYAVIHMETLDNHRNVIALVHLSPHVTGHFFTSKHMQVVKNLGAVLSKCCSAISFDVDVDGPVPPNSGHSQLLIFHDRICITTNQRYDFRLLGEWPIDSLTQLMTTPSGVILVIAGREEPLSLRTEKGNDIKSKLMDKVQCLSPASLQQIPYGSNLASGVTQCDGNSNIVPDTRKQSKSCELIHRLRDEPWGLNANSLPLARRNPALCQSQVPSLNNSALDLSCDKTVGKEELIDVRLNPLGIKCLSDSKITESTQKPYVYIPQHDNEVNAQKLLDLQSTESEIKDGREHSEKDLHEPQPPPIPQRRLKPSSEHTKQSNSVSNKRTASNSTAAELFSIPRSRSFQIVEQPLHERKKQRNKSESSVELRKTITELVRPIGIEPLYENSENSCNKTVDFKPLNNTCLLRHTDCKLISSQKSTETVQDEEKQASDKIHYVNLPEGSRPSCYLYMNLPDPKKAPKETVSYVNHVFMSRSMKGIYENVFCNTAVCSEETEPVPSLPPPPLLPRQPPPRIPRRLLTDRQGPLTARLPVTGPLPPPRPPKKDLTSVAKEDIQVQIAVFSSRAVVSRAWYLRVVVMRHDSDDSTFKTVKEREIASKYHLMQTYPFSISSDIVISLKHQRQQFRLTSENSQEVDYNIIENLKRGFWVVIEFHLEHLGSEADQFVGNVCVEPKHLPVGGKCPINKKFNLGITEDFELKQHCSNCIQLESHNMEENQPCKLVISDYALRRKVCEKLDMINSSYNWKDVAGQLNLFSVDEIKTIEDKVYRCFKFSPMDHVLTTWEQRDPGCSLERLVSILRDIQRLDVVCDLGYPVDLESS